MTTLKNTEGLRCLCLETQKPITKGALTSVELPRGVIPKSIEVLVIGSTQQPYTHQEYFKVGEDVSILPALNSPFTSTTGTPVLSNALSPFLEPLELSGLDVAQYSLSVITGNNGLFALTSAGARVAVNIADFRYVFRVWY